jgi:hypothetical protein
MSAVYLKPFLRVHHPTRYRCPICGFHTEKLYLGQTAHKDGLPGLKGMCPNLCHWILLDAKRLKGVLGIDNSRVRTMYRVKVVAALSLLRLPS